MKHSQARARRFRALVICAPAAAAAAFVAPAQAETAYALTTTNRLLSFDTNTPGVLASNQPINGLQSAEVLLGIDYRPLATGYQLFGLGSQNRVYRLNEGTGDATLIMQAGATPFALSGVEFGFDFNPTVDRIRVVSNADQNLRLNPITGGLAANDPAVIYQVGDSREGQDPNIVGSAYTNNVPGATTTVLFGIDSTQNTLVRQLANPNQNNLIHLLSTVGPLGFDTTHEVGFDISPATNIAFASLTFPGDTRSQLMSIDLMNGAANNIGPIGGVDLIRGLTIIPEPASLVLLALGGLTLIRRR